MDIKCLIDTNILIQLEEPDSTGRLRGAFAEFSEIAHKHGVRIFTHPDSLKEIARDRDEKRRDRTLSFAKKYPLLQNPPTEKKEELEKIFTGINKSNDLVDCQILYSLKLNCVDYLISEDDGLHKRAKYAGLNERVLSVKEASNLLRRLYEPSTVLYPNVQQEYVYSLRPEEAIFESLKGDYDDFPTWLEKCRKEHRLAWVVRVKDEIAAICIRKDEVGEDHFPGLGNKTLKLCTFKVGENYRGSKIGELLLKTAMTYALENGYDSVYLTAFTKHEYLTEFLKDFGFDVHHLQTDRGEFVYYKRFATVPRDLPRMNPVEFHAKYFPHFYDDSSIAKYIVPIKPKFHEVLFPEAPGFQGTLPLVEATRAVPGNTIKKVYLSNANISQVEAGGLIYFYRSEDAKSITTLGIVERATRTSDLSEIIRLVGKRSVYSVEEIRAMSSKPVLVIEFRWVKHFVPPLDYKKLKGSGVLLGFPQAMMALPHERYLLMEKLI